jgi:hypothetical protein
MDLSPKLLCRMVYIISEGCSVVVYLNPVHAPFDIKNYSLVRSLLFHKIYINLSSTCSTIFNTMSIYLAHTTLRSTFVLAWKSNVMQEVFQ